MQPVQRAHADRTASSRSAPPSTAEATLLASQPVASSPGERAEASRAAAASASQICAWTSVSTVAAYAKYSWALSRTSRVACAPRLRLGALHRSLGLELLILPQGHVRQELEPATRHMLVDHHREALRAREGAV